MTAKRDVVARHGDRGVRLIRATFLLDRAYARLDRLRSSVILALASDSVLDQFNDWVYSRADAYRPGTTSFRRQLHPWEEDVISRLFPRPPARILVGGAGAGREPLALAGRGYAVVAFEPARPLAEAMTQQAEAEAQSEQLTVLLGSYEDLPRLTRLADGSPVMAETGGPYHAAILGWGSFSHIRTESLRVRTFETFARLTAGPILVSFSVVRPGDAAPSRPRSVLGRMAARRGRQPVDRFNPLFGFEHPVNENEIVALAGRAGLKVVELRFAAAESLAPYAVFARSD